MDEDKEIRSKWKVGTAVEVYSQSRDIWIPVEIIRIEYEDDDDDDEDPEEWLIVCAEGKILKEVLRYDFDNVRPSQNVNNKDKINDASSTVSTHSTGSSGSSVSSGLYSSDDNNAHNKIDEKHESVVIYVERSGTDIFHGKYIYSKTSKDGYPIFIHSDNKNIFIKQNYLDVKWEFISNQKVYYYCESEDEYPPSSGWNNTKIGKLPNPGVRLDSSKPVIDDFFKVIDDPYKYSPFIANKYTFDKSLSLGFNMKTVTLHQTFVAVKYIEPNSQAEQFGIRTDDILVSVNDKDLSAIKYIDDVNKVINDIINELNDKQQLIFTFARKRNQFTILKAMRAGTTMVNGKYGVQGEAQDALLFVHNDNPNLTIQRIYVEQDDAVWVVREINIEKKDDDPDNSDDSDSDSDSDSDNDSDAADGSYKDYYMAKAHARDENPPCAGWEALEGVNPAVGLQHYPVDIETPIQPTITDIKPKTNAIELYYECLNELERRPTTCPHMDVWYEIDMKHYKYNHNTHKLSDKIFNTKTWTKDESSHIADGLINGDGYEFVVRTCNLLSITNSNVSKRIIPLQLPPKPIINDIKSEPGELFITFECNMYNQHDIQASFEIIIHPELEEKNQIYPIKDNKFLVVDITDKPVQLNNVLKGEKYKITVSSVNTVGVTYSESKYIQTLKQPTKPIITDMKSENNELYLSFECDTDMDDDKTSFEIIIDPILDGSNQIYKMKDNKFLVPAIADKPIQLNNLVKGTKYEVTVASVNNVGVTYSESKSIQTLKDPPKPMITDIKHESDTLYISFECDMYNMPDVQATFEIIVDPPLDGTNQLYEIKENRFLVSDITDKPIELNNIVKGLKYEITVAALNTVGVTYSKSEYIQTLKDPPKPIITDIKHASDKLYISFECDFYNVADIDASFEIIMDPVLDDNNQLYEMKQNKFLVSDIMDKPIQLNNVSKGTKYEVIVASVNGIGVTYSEPKYIQTLKDPPKPIITDIKHESDAFYISFDCDTYDMPDVGASFEINIDPPLNGNNQLYEMKENTFLVSNIPVKPIQLNNVLKGTKYDITIASINTAGITYSETKSIQTLTDPPKPVITNIKNEMNKLYISFECDTDDVNASFEIIINPSLDGNNQIYKMKENKFFVFDISDKPVQLNNVIPNTKYEITVACVNQIGITYSKSKSIHTSKKVDKELEQKQKQLVMEKLDKLRVDVSLLEDNMNKINNKIKVLHKTNDDLFKQVRFMTQIKQNNERNLKDLEAQNLRLQEEFRIRTLGKLKFVEKSNQTMDELRGYLLKYQNMINHVKQ